MVRRTDDGREDPVGDLADDTLHVGWEQTVGDMHAMAADRQDKGYETIAMASGNTAAVAPSQGDDDRIGFSHLVDRSDGEAFRERYAGGHFTDTGVYQAVDGGHVFMVTEHVDYDNEVVVFIAGTYRVMDAADLVRAAMERGTFYTYVRKLDRTVLGTFEHDDPAAFFPDPDVYFSHEPTMG